MKKILTICTGFLSLAAAHCMQDPNTVGLMKMDNFLVEEQVDGDGIACLIIYDRHSFRYSDGHLTERKCVYNGSREERADLLNRMAARIAALCVTCSQQDFSKAARFLKHVDAPEARSALYKRFETDPALKDNAEIARLIDRLKQ